MIPFNPESLIFIMILSASNRLITFLKDSLLDFQCGKTEESEHPAQYPEPRNDLALRPAGKLEMMMKRGHLKHPLPCPFKGIDLNHYRGCLDNEHATYDEEKDFFLQNERQKS